MELDVERKYIYIYIYNDCGRLQDTLQINDGREDEVPI